MDTQNPGTVTRADLAEAVYREIGLSRSESAELVESVINYICDALLKGSGRHVFTGPNAMQEKVGHA